MPELDRLREGDDGQAVGDDLGAGSGVGESQPRRDDDVRTVLVDHPDHLAGVLRARGPGGGERRSGQLDRFTPVGRRRTEDDSLVENRREHQARPNPARVPVPGQKPKFGTTVRAVGGGYVVEGTKAFATGAIGAQWAILFLNTTAGISVISQEAPMFQELTRVNVAVAAGMGGIASIGNALGRVLWAWISDSITRRATFIVMFAMQVLLFWTLPGISTVAVVTAVAFVILMCYGGGFGTKPRPSHGAEIAR